MRSASPTNSISSWFADLSASLLHLAVPHVCTGCGTNLPGKENLLCLRCLSSLPKTSFEKFGNNPVEKYFTEDYRCCMPLLNIISPKNL